MEIKRMKRLYTHLWRANQALNSAFSLILLINMTLCLVMVTIYLYIGTNMFLLSTLFVETSVHKIAFSLTLYSAILYFILTTSDTPVQQVTSQAFPRIPCSTNLLGLGESNKKGTHQIIDARTRYRCPVRIINVPYVRLGGPNADFGGRLVPRWNRPSPECEHFFLLSLDRHQSWIIIGTRCFFSLADYWCCDNLFDCSFECPVLIGKQIFIAVSIWLPISAVH